MADDVQRATAEASRRIAAIHGSPAKRKKKRAATRKPVEDPPDICSRPPSDVPPPRGEGWRRLGPVSAVSGSNRISAPPQSRRALTREIEVFLDGRRYCIVPADIDSGGGFCVSLGRDFEGETNMACMLYLRKKKKPVKVAIWKEPGVHEEDHFNLQLRKVSQSLLLSSKNRFNFPRERTVSIFFSLLKILSEIIEHTSYYGSYIALQ